MRGSNRGSLSVNEGSSDFLWDLQKITYYNKPGLKEVDIEKT